MNKFNQYDSKKLSDSTEYERPDITITELIQNKKDIEEQLKMYEEIPNNDLCYIALNTHLKYLSYYKKTKKELFRFGGLLIKLDKEYLVLSGKDGIRFSVQRYTKDTKGNILHTTRFFKKMNQSNIKDKIDNEKNNLTEYNKKIRKLKTKLK
jgi:hypothetical protein